MTEKAIQEQIQKQISALQKTTAIATKSKEAAKKYLQDAGIIGTEKQSRFGFKPKG